MVPIGATATFDDTTGPFRVPRYNLFPAAEVQLNLSRNFSSGQGIAAAERIAKERLPGGFAFEWTEIAPAARRGSHRSDVHPRRHDWREHARP